MTTRHATDAEIKNLGMAQRPTVPFFTILNVEGNRSFGRSTTSQDPGWGPMPHAHAFDTEEAAQAALDHFGLDGVILTTKREESA